MISADRPPSPLEKRHLLHPNEDNRDVQVAFSLLTV